MSGIIERLKLLFIVNSCFIFDLQTSGLMIGVIDFLGSTGKIIYFIHATFAGVFHELRNEIEQVIIPAYICAAIASVLLVYASVKRDYVWAILWIVANTACLILAPIAFIGAWTSGVQKANYICLMIIISFGLRFYFHMVIYSLYKKAEQKEACGKMII